MLKSSAFVGILGKSFKNRWDFDVYSNFKVIKL